MTEEKKLGGGGGGGGWGGSGAVGLSFRLMALVSLCRQII